MSKISPQVAFEGSDICIVAISTRCHKCNNKLMRADLIYAYCYFCDNIDCYSVGYDQSYAHPELITSCCKNPNPQFVKFIQTNRVITIRKGCVNCFKLEGKSYKRSEHPDFQNYPEITNRQRYEIEKYIRNKKNEIAEYCKLEKQKSQENNVNQWWYNYTEYLTNDQWLNIRRKVMKRDNYTCQGCLDVPADQVHHKTYNHYNNGYEMIFDLISLCNKCHNLLHGT